MLSAYDIIMTIRLYIYNEIPACPDTHCNVCNCKNLCRIYRKSIDMIFEGGY